LEKELVYELMDAFKGFKGLRPNAFKESDVKNSEFMLLIKLDKFLSKNNETKAKTTDLSKILELSPSTITPLINSLEEKGYLKREYDKTDRRIVLLSFTEEGYSLKEKMNTEFNNRMKGLIKHLGEKDTKELIRLLKKCGEYVNKKEEINKCSK